MWEVKVLVAQLCLQPQGLQPVRPPVHGILQARILEWVAIPFSRESSRPRDQTQVSCIVDRRFTVWATREVHVYLQLVIPIYSRNQHKHCKAIIFHLKIQKIKQKLDTIFCVPSWQHFCFIIPSIRMEKGNRPIASKRGYTLINKLFQKATGQPVSKVTRLLMSQQFYV